MKKPEVALYNKDNAVHLQKPITFKCKKLADADDVWLEFSLFLINLIKTQAFSQQMLADLLGLERTGLYVKLSRWFHNPASKVEVLCALKILLSHGFNCEIKITNGAKPATKPVKNRKHPSLYKSTRDAKLKLKRQHLAR